MFSLDRHPFLITFFQGLFPDVGIFQIPVRFLDNFLRGHAYLMLSSELSQSIYCNEFSDRASWMVLIWTAT